MMNVNLNGLSLHAKSLLYHTTGNKVDNHDQWMHFLTRYHNYAGGVALMPPQPIKNPLSHKNKAIVIY